MLSLARGKAVEQEGQNRSVGRNRVKDPISSPPDTRLEEVGSSWSGLEAFATLIVRSISSTGNDKETQPSFLPRGSWSSLTIAIGVLTRMNSDFKDLLRLFNAHKVRYLVVGGYAVSRSLKVSPTGSYQDAGGI